MNSHQGNKQSSFELKWNEANQNLKQHCPLESLHSMKDFTCGRIIHCCVVSYSIIFPENAWCRAERSEVNQVGKKWFPLELHGYWFSQWFYSSSNQINGTQKIQAPQYQPHQMNGNYALMPKNSALFFFLLLSFFSHLVHYWSGFDGFPKLNSVGRNHMKIMLWTKLNRLPSIQCIIYTVAKSICRYLINFDVNKLNDSIIPSISVSAIYRI